MATLATPDLASDLHLFSRIVEAQSLRAVAEELGVQPSVVSRRLARLEARLGMKLITRSRVASVPTDAGARYYQDLVPLLEGLQEAEARVRGMADEPTGLLRIAAPVDFGARFVAPLVGKMQADFPELQVQLQLGSRFQDLVSERIDVAVRIGRLADSALRAQRIGVVPRVLVASASYLKRHGTPQTVSDLRRHDFVLYSPRSPTSVLRFAGGRDIEVRGRLAVNSVRAIQELVSSGYGLHLGPRWAFESQIASRKIRVVPLDVEPVSYPLHTLRPEGRYVPAKVRVFVERFRSLVAQEKSLTD